MARSPNSSTQTLNVLRALAADGSAWRYGYDLSRETDLRSGTLYPILMRLADQGWLETEWEERTVHGRPPRHLYRLTAVGAGAAETLLLGSRPSYSRAKGTPSPGPVNAS